MLDDRPLLQNRDLGALFVAAHEHDPLDRRPISSLWPAAWTAPALARFLGGTVRSVPLGAIGILGDGLNVRGFLARHLLRHQSDPRS
jgi:hypothetical protein